MCLSLDVSSPLRGTPRWGRLLGVSFLVGVIVGLIALASLGFIDTFMQVMYVQYTSWGFLLSQQQLNFSTTAGIVEQQNRGTSRVAQIDLTYSFGASCCIGAGIVLYFTHTHDDWRNSSVHLYLPQLSPAQKSRGSIFDVDCHLPLKTGRSYSTVHDGQTLQVHPPPPQKTLVTRFGEILLLSRASTNRFNAIVVRSAL